MREGIKAKEEYQLLWLPGGGSAIRESCSFPG